MMTVAAAVGILAIGAPARTSLAFSEGRFVIHAPHEKPLAVELDRREPEPTTHVNYRLNQTFVVWDERGLSIRTADGVTTTRFKEIPVSPRLRPRDEIRATLAHQYSLEASALAGSKRFGKTVYLVVRWLDENDAPWLEALVSVDLSAESPRAQALAVLPGISFSSGTISDNLLLSPDGVRILIHEGPVWGVWSYSASGDSGSFKQLGDGVKYASAVSPARACYMEKTTYGDFVAGTADLATGARSDCLETALPVRIVEPGNPPVVESDLDSGGREVTNLITGAGLRLASGLRYRRTPFGLLVWDGGRSPSRAWLYGFADWSPVAWWRRS